MLHFESHANMKSPLTGECSRIVVYNKNNDPIAIVIELNDDVCITTHIGDDDFLKWVDTLDIKSTTIEDTDISFGC